MADIRTPTPKGALNLPTVGDFKYSYVMEDSNFPSGSELYFLIGVPPVPSVRWDFVIAGDTATIKIESTALAPIKAGTKFWLMYSPVDGDEQELLTGTVKKVNA